MGAPRAHLKVNQKVFKSILKVKPLKVVQNMGQSHCSHKSASACWLQLLLKEDRTICAITNAVNVLAFKVSFIYLPLCLFPCKRWVYSKQRQEKSSLDISLPWRTFLETYPTLDSTLVKGQYNYKPLPSLDCEFMTPKIFTHPGDQAASLKSLLWAEV